MKPRRGDWEGQVLSKHADPADPDGRDGRSASASFGRGIPRNVRFLVGDGQGAATLFADETLRPPASPTSPA